MFSQSSAHYGYVPKKRLRSLIEDKYLNNSANASDVSNKLEF